MSECEGGCFFDAGEFVFLRSVFPLRTYETVGNILEDCALEEDRLLLYETDVLAEPIEIELVDGTAVEGDAT